MKIQSTKVRRSVRVAERRAASPGVILAVAEPPTANASGLQPGLYSFPQASTESEVNAALLSFSKTASSMLAKQLHPHVGTAVRLGWLVVGAVKLLDDIGKRDIEWNEVLLKSGKLCLDSYVTASKASLVPDHLQLSDDWSGGIGFLLDATQAAVDDEHMNTFQMGYILDQSPPVELTRSLLAIATAAESPSNEFADVNKQALPIDFLKAPDRQVA